VRILVGHTNQIPEIKQHHPLPGRADKHDAILAFGNGHRQVAYEPGMTWNELRAQCPLGWEPDVYIHWSLEYNALPEGLENAPCLTVGIVGDWNLGGQAIRNIGHVFDVLIADRNGCAFLRHLGFTNVHYAPLWAYTPELHRRLPGVRRDVDVMMIGNFNHAIQRERAHWLAHVARLSRKHRVVLTCGVFGEDYVQAVNRAKIVFNRSIRGEINMRAYEAAACGALLFYEEENTEIREMFTDREHCVLYNDANLEELLAYYLAPKHAAERERIAEAGRWRVHEHTYARHFSLLLDVVEPLLAVHDPASRGRRYFGFAPPLTPQIRLASQWLCSSDRTIYPRLDALLTRLQSDKSANAAEQAELANLHAALLGEWAYLTQAPSEQTTRLSAALSWAQRALQLEPDYLGARCNLGFLYFAAGQAEEAEKTLRDVAERLASPTVVASQLRGVYFPRRFDYFDVEIERIWGEATPGTSAWCAQMQSLLAWCIHANLTSTALTRGDVQTALYHAEQAVVQRPALGETLHSLAQALSAGGNKAEALDACCRAVKDAPFLLPAWQDLAQLHFDLHRPADALKVLDEILTLLDGCPVYAGARPAFERLRTQARESLRSQARSPALSNAVPLRLLAFPDWAQPDQWQELVRAFASAYRPSDPALLMLRADPVTDPPAETLLFSLEIFLTGEMGLPSSELPNITLLNQPLVEGELRALFQVADALITLEGNAPKPAYQAHAIAARVPIWTLAEMTLRRAA
jgi:tetratricopeptide (TPR) repeat protein